MKTAWDVSNEICDQHKRFLRRAEKEKKEEKEEKTNSREKRRYK